MLTCHDRRLLIPGFGDNVSIPLQTFVTSGLRLAARCRLNLVYLNLEGKLPPARIMNNLPYLKQL
jgi:hypothetical protein